MKNHETFLYDQILQVDGSDSILNTSLEIQAEAGQKIPVQISQYRNQIPILQQRIPPFLKTIKRNSDILQSIQLPVVINLNPRSIYNKTDEFSQMLEQYSPELMTRCQLK